MLQAYTVHSGLGLLLNMCAYRCHHVLQEWFHFVDKEKQVRIRIDGKVNQMIAEAAELKQWTISEVHCCPKT